MDRYTIDRFENSDWAVLEDEHARTFSVPRQWLPPDAREGDVLNATEEDAGPGVRLLRFMLDPTAREERLGRARQLRDKLPRGPKGDVSL